MKPEEMNQGFSFDDALNDNGNFKRKQYAEIKRQTAWKKIKIGAGAFLLGGAMLAAAFFAPVTGTVAAGLGVGGLFLGAGGKQAVEDGVGTVWSADDGIEDPGQDATDREAGDSGASGEDTAGDADGAEFMQRSVDDGFRFIGDR